MLKDDDIFLFFFLSDDANLRRFNSISLITGRCVVDNERLCDSERLCAMKTRE